MSERRFAVGDFATNADRFDAYENLCDQLELACELKDKEALKNFGSIADAQLEHGLRIDVLRAERERNLESIRQGNDIIARQRVELAEITDLRDMIILCGEEECRDVVGYPQKLRALIDGLITVRRERDALLDELDAMKSHQKDMYNRFHAETEHMRAQIESMIKQLLDNRSINPDPIILQIPVIPEGMAIVPVSLTAENGAKAALCGEKFADEYVSWSSIKEIHKAVVALFAAAQK